MQSSDAGLRPKPHPWAYVPTLFMSSPNYNHKNFLDRLESVWTNFQEFIAAYFINWILYFKFSKYHTKVSLDALHRESKLLLLGFPQALDYVQPLTRDMAPFSGTCKTKSVDGQFYDTDLKNFVEDSKSKGTIVIAFGHMIQWNSAPVHVKANFIIALNKLIDYRILWQFNEDTSKLGIFGHVKCMEWLPQEMLLLHPKTKLFISHGGLKSITESICAGVPAIVIPFFAEQTRNAHLLVKSGSGLFLSKFHLTPDSIFNAIEKIVNNDSYTVMVKKLRNYFVDRPIDAIDYGAFWTEFTIRHKNSIDKWFRLRCSFMSSLQYLMLDIVFAFVLGLFLVLCLIVRLKKFFIN